jgi:hypothetical protein
VTSSEITTIIYADNDEIGKKGLVLVTEKTEGASETLRGWFETIWSGLGGRWLRNGDSLGRFPPDVFINLYKLLKQSLHFKV